MRLAIGADADANRLAGAGGIEHELRRRRDDRRGPLAVGRELLGQALTEANRLRPIGLPQDDAVVVAGARAHVDHQQPAAVGGQRPRAGRSDPRQVALGLLAGHARAHAHRQILAHRQPSPVARDVEDDEAGGHAEDRLRPARRPTPARTSAAASTTPSVLPENRIVAPSGVQASPCTANSSPVSVVTFPARSTTLTQPRSSKRTLVLDEGDAAAVGRHARIAQVAARLVERRAGRELEPIAHGCRGRARSPSPIRPATSRPRARLPRRRAASCRWSCGPACRRRGADRGTAGPR